MPYNYIWNSFVWRAAAGEGNNISGIQHPIPDIIKYYRGFTLPKTQNTLLFSQPHGNEKITLRQGKQKTY